MFPLGSAVFPQQVIPLHVFEPRYREMMEHITESENPEFGIVLIDRGHEVGGGDQRSNVGTRVRVLQTEQFDDGRWACVVAGIERIDVVEWLPDDPYPRAMVTSREVVDNGGSDLAQLEADVIETITMITTAAGVDEGEVQYQFSDDVLVRLDQLSAVAPVSDFDRQHVLEAGTTSEQMAVLSAAIANKQMLLRAQLGHGEEFG